VSIGADRKVHVTKHVLELETIRVTKRTLEQRCGDLEPDPSLIGVGLERAARDFQHVEREFHHHVARRRVGIQDLRPILRAELGIDDRYATVDRNRMCDVVAHVVRERAERKRVLVDIPRVPHQRLDEITGPDVVDEI
jgi:hypothetical protein